MKNKVLDMSNMENFKARKSRLKKSQFKSVFFVIAFSFLFLYAMSLVLPLILALFNSLKGRFDLLQNPFGFPKKFRFENYVTAYQQLYVPVKIAGGGSRNVYMAELFFNTFLYTIGCTIMATLSPCIVAYAVAKYRFKLGKIIYSFVIFTMILPIVGSLPSEMLVVRTLGLYDKIWGAWIMKGGFLGLYFLVFYATWKGFAWDYAEAAFMDGAGHFSVLFRIMLPLARSTIFAVGLLVFIGFWNEYYTQLVYMPSWPSITYGLWQYQFKSEGAASSTTVQLAGSVIVCIPVLIIFLIFKDKLIGNIAVGGIKG